MPIYFPILHKVCRKTILFFSLGGTEKDKEKITKSKIKYDSELKALTIWNHACKTFKPTSQRQ